MPAPAESAAGSDRLLEATGPGARPDCGLSRRQRLTRSDEFRETYQQGRKWVGRYMVLWLRSGEGSALRLGVVASRRVGKAVARNRARRLLREAYRRNRHRFTGSYDVVLVARWPLPRARYGPVESELRRLAGRAGLLPSPESRLREPGP